MRASCGSSTNGGRTLEIVGDADYEREFQELAADERRRGRRRARLNEAVRDLPDDVYAGTWLDEKERLVVAVTRGAEELARSFEAQVPPDSFRVVTVPRSFAELERLVESIMREADREQVLFAVIAVRSEQNRVEAELLDLDAPASRRLRERFADQPVDWSEGPRPEAAAQAPG